MYRIRDLILRQMKEKAYQMEINLHQKIAVKATKKMMDQEIRLKKLQA